MIDGKEPPRRWRQWWRGLPGYWRIAAWTAFAVVFPQVAIAGWLCSGHFESRDITRLRQQGAKLQYAWEYTDPMGKLGLPLPNWLREWLTIGYNGKTTHQVIYLHFVQEIPNSAAQETIGQSFPRLEVLSFYNPDHSDTSLNLTGLGKCRSLKHLTFDGIVIDEVLVGQLASVPQLIELYFKDCEFTTPDLSPLAQCVWLEGINFDGSNVTDDHIRLLGRLSQLEQIRLRGTNVTDASIPVLKYMEGLRFIDLYFTNTSISQAEIDAWKSSHPDRSMHIWTDQRQLDGNCVLRWADARLSGILDKSNVKLIGPSASEGATSMSPIQVPTFSPDSGCLDFSQLANGRYRLTCRQGEFESEPVFVDVQEGAGPKGWIEFRMSCTKAEALRAENK